LIQDKRRWFQWLFKAKKRYGLVILNYTVTSNHIHLLVFDEKGRDVISNSIKLVTGRTGQEYNIRKNVLIAHQELTELASFETYNIFREAHLEMVDESLANGKNH
jgi:REP element-mobilizing transposase RayT